MNDLMKTKTPDDAKEYMAQCSEWYAYAYKAISEAGGDPAEVLELIPRDILHLLIANKLHLAYDLGSKQ